MQRKTLFISSRHFLLNFKPFCHQINAHTLNRTFLSKDKYYKWPKHFSILGFSLCSFWRCQRKLLSPLLNDKLRLKTKTKDTLLKPYAPPITVNWVTIAIRMRAMLMGVKSCAKSSSFMMQYSVDGLKYGWMEMNALKLDVDVYTIFFFSSKQKPLIVLYSNLLLFIRSAWQAKPFYRAPIE